MFLYYATYYSGEEYIYKMETKYLFGLIPQEKFFFSEKNIDINRSPFVKSCIDIKVVKDSLEEIVSFIKENKVSYNDFKVKYFDTDDSMEFNEKHRVEGIVGYVVQGEACVRHPEIILALTRVNNKWIFGEYKKSNSIWRIHKERPYQYSNALPTNISRAIVNIATGENNYLRLVDPCCGAGTVVMEGLSMEVNIEGFDINPKIVENAKENLRFFNYPDVIEIKDICEIDEHFDVAIIDIPYGLLSITTRELQKSIIKNGRRIADKMILVSLDTMEEDLKEAEFKIIDRCEVFKGDFKRYITICE